MAKKTKKVVLENSVVGGEGWESKLEDFFVKKLPALPKSVKEALVNFGPWIDVVLIVLMLPWLFAFLGLGSVVMPMSYMMSGFRYGYRFGIVWWVQMISLGLNLWALPGLFKRKMFAWRLMYYAVIVSAVGSLLNGNLIGGLLNAAIGFYVLFQIKGYYK